MPIKILTPQEIEIEFNRQLSVLTDNEINSLCGLTIEQFTKIISKFKSKLELLELSYGEGKLPFIVCFRKDFVDITSVFLKVFSKKKHGFVDMNPYEPSVFLPIVELPESEIYIIINVETGYNYLNISPANCLVDINRRSRAPLTMEEGAMLTLFFPEILENKKDFNAIQMPGSRKLNDERVPSIWFSKGAPRLGWCWDNNVHTWLGSASCGNKVM
jgi:Family of unknown function (DUF5701)